MAATSAPSRQQVHDWMMQRQKEHAPPPSPERIRQELGWHMLPNNPRHSSTR